MLKTTLLINVALAAGLIASTTQAADLAAGQKQFEATCAACHGAAGISIAPIYPNLAGQKEEYLVTSVKAYRDGTRTNAIMQPMAKPLTDIEILNIAAFLATLKP